MDTCGAGDWATAGLIELTCQTGLNDLIGLSKEKVLNALGFSQRLGSWNCGFAGAHGSMYGMSKGTLLKEIKKLAPPKCANDANLGDPEERSGWHEGMPVMQRKGISETT